MRPKTNFRECTLHVSNIPNETTDGDLSFLFREYIVTKLALIDKNQKKFARVTFTSPEMANNVKNNLTGICFLPWSSLTGQMTCLSISKVEEKRDGYFEDETNKNILVKNLPDEMTGRKFYLFMSQFGELKTIKFKLDNFWKNVGYAEAYYSSKEAARKSLETINRKEKLSEVLGNGEFDFIKDSNMMATYMVKGMIMEDLETDTTEVKNNLYVKNIPMSYTSEDLKNYFSKYGKITSCVISTDSKGESKGFGFVCYENPKHAAEAIIIENKIKNKFPTCNSPIYVSYAMKKEERDESLMKDNLNGDSTILFARLREDIKVTNNSEIINEVQSSVNLILGTEYSAKMIKANLEAKSALIVFQRKKDVDEFISNYTEFVKNYLPKVLFNYYRTTPGQLNSYIGDINAVANPIFMFNNLTKFDSNMKKGIKKEGQNTRGWGNEKESNKDKQPYNPANKQPYNPANKTPFNPANKPFNPANKEPYNPANKPFNPANKEPFTPANKEESNQASSGPYNPANKPFNPANKEPFNPANKEPFNPANKTPFNPANNTNENNNPKPFVPGSQPLTYSSTPFVPNSQKSKFNLNAKPFIPGNQKNNYNQPKNNEPEEEEESIYSMSAYKKSNLREVGCRNPDNENQKNLVEIGRKNSGNANPPIGHKNSGNTERKYPWDEQPKMLREVGCWNPSNNSNANPQNLREIGRKNSGNANPPIGHKNSGNTNQERKYPWDEQPKMLREVGCKPANEKPKTLEEECKEFLSVPNYQRKKSGNKPNTNNLEDEINEFNNLIQGEEKKNINNSNETSVYNLFRPIPQEKKPNVDEDGFVTVQPKTGFGRAWNRPGGVQKKKSKKTEQENKSPGKQKELREIGKPQPTKELREIGKPKELREIGKPQPTKELREVGAGRFEPKKETKEVGTLEIKKDLKEFGIYEGDNEAREELFKYVYEYIDSKYPIVASKITGMIIDLGEREVKYLYKHKEYLDKVIEDAKELLQKK